MTLDEQKEFLENFKKQYDTSKEMLDIERDISYILEKQNQSLSSYIDSKKQILETQKRINLANSGLTKLKEKQKALQSIINGLDADSAEIYEEELKNLTKIISLTEKKLKLDEQELEVLKKNLNIYKAIGNSLVDFGKELIGSKFTFMSIWEYLQKVDGGIRSMQLNMGLSGERAKILRQQMQEAANTAQRFGGTIDDIVELQTNVNELTGRATVFTEHQIANMVAIAKGTGMANQETANLVGNMLALGSSVEDSKKLIEDTVNETAKLGLNSLSVLKGMSTNIDKLNNYRFQNGVEGLKKMVEASKKFQFTMEGAFAAADKFRTLEGLLETGANLRVLGGEFAKMDEFKLSFLARNKPEEFAVEMAKLTKGMASFNKETGMFDISDVDFDRLRSVAELTGRTIDDVANSTRELNKQELAKKQILIGTDKEKEMIAKLATFQKGSTIGTIEIGDKNVRLDKLTDDLKTAFLTEQQTLEQRAIESQNFNDTFNNTIMQFKSTLLPVLKAINYTLTLFNSVIDIARDENGKMRKWAAAVPITIMAATMGLFKLFGALPSVLGKIPSIGKFFSGGASAAASAAKGSGGNPFGNLRGIGAGQIAAAGKANFLTSLGTATTIIGIGAALYFAAKGASALADSIAKLNSDQTTTLIATMAILGATITGTVVGSIHLLGKAGAAAAPELYALGGAVALIGGGIGIAAAGVGYMVEAQSKLVGSMINLVKTIPETITSLTQLANIDTKNLTSAVGELFNLSNISVDNLIPLQNLKFVDKDIQNMKEMAALVAQINAIDTSKLNALKNLFSSGEMKVKLDGNPVIQNNIVVEVDGQIFYRKVEKAVPLIVQRGIDTRSLNWDSL